MIILLVKQVGHNDTTGGDADNAIGGTGSLMMILLFVVLVLILLLVMIILLFGVLVIRLR